MKRATIVLLCILCWGCATLSREDEPKQFFFSFRIMDEGAASERELASFLQRGNPAISRKDARELAMLYREEASAEGVNSDVAFVQMCLETGFLTFQGSISPEQHNYCGLGAVDAASPGESFPSARIGVRAHIQHLKAYGSTEDLRLESVDRRFRFVQRGRAVLMYDLARSWAMDPNYGVKLERLMDQLFLSVLEHRGLDVPEWENPGYEM